MTGVLAHGPMYMNSSAGPWITEDIRARINESAHKVCAHIARAYEERVSGIERKEKIHWLDISGASDASVSRCAHYFDLILIGQYEEIADQHYLLVHPEAMAQQSGKPVMMVPRSYDVESVTKRAVIAWDDRRASARALTDAMALLASHPQVTVLSIGDAAEKVPNGLNIANHLNRHGLNAEWVKLKRTGPIGETILKYCQEVDAGLLVMGAYEHSKFREDLLGGVTNYVLRQAALPVLMSH